MKYDPADPQLFVRNRSRLAQLLKPSSIAIFNANDVMPINADGIHPFYQNADLLYTAGIDQEETILLLFPDAQREEEREILFLREPTEHIAIWEGKKLTKEKATELSGIKKVMWSHQFDAVFHRLVQQAENIYLNTNEHLRAEVSVESRDLRFIRKCKNSYPLHKYERLAPLMHQLRMIKDPEEIKIIQHACDITEAGFRRVLNFIKPGVGEWEIEAEFIHEFTRRKSKGFAYGPIIASGEGAMCLHYIENNKVCEDGELILMDVAAEYGNWQSDLTRTVPVNGKFTDRQRDVYNSVLNVLRKCNDIMRPGMVHSEYQKQSVLFVEEELIKLGLVDAEEAKKQSEDRPLTKKYFMHGTSHHMGIDVHDVHLVDAPFEVGMVFTIEPGIYIPEENIAVRLENDILIGENENIDMMANIPIEADEIEALMAENS